MTHEPSANKIISKWLNQIGFQVQHIEFEGKSLGFRGHLDLNISFEGPVDGDATLLFSGTVTAFAPFKSKPIVEYQIESRWKRHVGDWRLVSWSDVDGFRKTQRSFLVSDDGQSVVGRRRASAGDTESAETHISLTESRKKYKLAEGEILMDPLTASIFGATRPEVSETGGLAPENLYVLYKSGIKKIPIQLVDEDLRIHFDQTEIFFKNLKDKTYTQISVKDPRLPISVVMNRTTVN